MEKNLQAPSDSEDEDGIVTGLSDAGEEDSETQPNSIFALEKTKLIDDEDGKKLERACCENTAKSGRGRFDVFCTGESLETFDNFNKETMDFLVQPTQVERTSKQDLKLDSEFKRITNLEKSKISTDTTELIRANDDGGDDIDFQTRKDLFSARFHKLALNRKVEDFDTGSFSSGFFARSKLSQPQNPWFDTSIKTEREVAGSEAEALVQDEDLENNPGRLLAAERERLKLRERQDKMAIEVQRMRERLVNLGIAVAEIAYDGEGTDRKGDGEEKFSGYESPSKRSVFAAYDAADFEDSCLPNLPSETSGSAQPAVKRAPSFSLQDRIADSTESLCSAVVSKKNGNDVATSEPCNLRNLDGPKIDLWQIKAREEPEGRLRQTVVEVGKEMETTPLAVQTPSAAKQDEKSIDKQGSNTMLGVEDPLICRLIKIPSKAEVGRVLGNRGERNAAAQVLTSQEQSPCNRAAAGSHATKSLESELVRKKEHEIVTNYKVTRSSSMATVLSPTFGGRALKSRENNLLNFEEGNVNVEQRLDGRHSNTKPIVNLDNHASCLPPSCTLHTCCKDSLPSTKPFETSDLERREMFHEDEETDFQGDSQLIRTQRLFGRCRSVNMNVLLAGEIPGVEAHDRLPCSVLEPVGGEEPYVSTTPTLPRPVEDYQKSLYDLMEAADRAASLFGEVRSVCRRTTPTSSSEVPCTTPSTSVSLDIFSLSRTYQRLLPGTLQTVQRLADEAAACGLPCSRAVMHADNDNNFSPGADLVSSSATGSNILQSRPGTGTSSSLASVDVEGFISRFSETLASQVLALVHKALPGKQS